MKKFLLIIAAIMTVTFGFTSCEIEKSEITVNVKNMDGNPVAERRVYWSDLAEDLVGTFAPDPDEPLKSDEQKEKELKYVVTNDKGTCVFEYTMAVKSMPMYFYVFDEGSRQWKSEYLNLKRGENATIEFKVNK